MKSILINQKNICAGIALLMAALITLHAAAPVATMPENSQNKSMELATTDNSMDKVSGGIESFKNLGNFSLLPALAISALKRAAKTK